MADVMHYDWSGVFSRQTGHDAEITLVLGAKGIGKTYGIRKQLVQWFIDGKRGRFVEVCRTKDERNYISGGYFDKLVSNGEFAEWDFRTDSKCGYIARHVDEDENGRKPKQKWEVICYFVALTNFQTEKKRTFANVSDFIFDEFIIDSKDVYHRYLPNEFSILANLVDSITREQPFDGSSHHIYMLGNACDLTCPHLRACGVNDVPEFGYRFYKDRMVLVHYVEPWDARERQAGTLAGRMLQGSEESKMVFDNLFDDSNSAEIKKKPGNAKFAFGFIFKKNRFGIWIDYANGYAYVTGTIPNGCKPVYALTRKDATLDYQAIKKNDDLLKMVSKFFYSGVLRYDKFSTREMFLNLLAFLGVQ